MRRLHPRGRASRGVVVDAEGAMLGPDCILVRRSPEGFRCVAPGEARPIQAALLGPGQDPDWLFEQSLRIAQALNAGEVALAQIYGLRISLGDLDNTALRRLAVVARLIKAGFDPNEPRIPKGEPGAGQWTYEPGYAKPRAGHGQPGAGDERGDQGPATSEGSSGSGEGDVPSDAGGNESPQIPAKRPDTAKERNTIARRSAEWLHWVATIGASRVRDSRGRLFFATLEATAWILEYLPEIRSYLDEPKSLAELQNAVNDPQSGYQIHHIVEGQYKSESPEANSRRFPDRLEAGDNLVRIPKWTHVEISSWYSTGNDLYGGLTPRAYLRGKSWDEQYELGLNKLRDFEVLK